ncbi:MAG: redoxin domain-containing protein [Alistipes sp.]
MKRIILFAAVLLAAVGCTNKKHYIIDGTVGNIEGTLYLLDHEANVVDSTVVENGKFRLEGNVEAVDFHYLATEADGEKNVLATLILEPGVITVADVEGEEHKSVAGTPANDANAAWRKTAKALIAEYREADEVRRAQIGEEYDKLMKETYEANHDNLLGVYLLASELAYDMSGEELLAELDKLSPALQSSRIATKLRTQAEQRIKTDIGKPYIDIEQPNAAGETVSLKSVVENPANKYVLVDFWASWCGPCMGEVPELVAAYKQYHSQGLEIYGVSFDRKAENWTETIKKHEMAWINVSLLSSFDNQAATDYSIQAIPSNVLIDCATGTIVAKNLRGEAVAEKFAELFK